MGRQGTTRKCRITKGNEVLEFNSIREAAKFLGVHPSTIRSSEKFHCLCKGYKAERLDYTSHCQSKTKLYKVWIGMKDRCYREAHKYYEFYGGKGIRVCDEWLHDYIAFKVWAENNGYRDGLTIDRIDNNKDYSPDNCRWATMKEQLNNRSSNRIIDYKGKSYTLSQLSEFSGIKRTTLKARLDKGWPVEEAVEIKVGKYTKAVF